MNLDATEVIPLIISTIVGAGAFVTMEKHGFKCAFSDAIRAWEVCTFWRSFTRPGLSVYRSWLRFSGNIRKRPTKVPWGKRQGTPAEADRQFKSSTSGLRIRFC